MFAYICLQKSAVYKAKRSEASSRAALSIWAADHGWSIVFFDGESGAPRTGIVDVLLTRIAPRRPDTNQVRHVFECTGKVAYAPIKSGRSDSFVSSVVVFFVV